MQDSGPPLPHLSLASTLTGGPLRSLIWKMCRSGDTASLESFGNVVLLWSWLSGFVIRFWFEIPL